MKFDWLFSRLLVFSNNVVITDKLQIDASIGLKSLFI